jgi:hypothetical protein
MQNMHVCYCDVVVSMLRAVCRTLRRCTQGQQHDRRGRGADGQVLLLPQRMLRLQRPEDTRGVHGVSYDLVQVQVLGLV